METEDKKYIVIISERASEMLVSNTRFLAQVSEQAAQNLIEEFKASVKSLEGPPERNPRLDVPAMPINKYRKLLLGKQYLLIYQIKGAVVYVDYFVDCRQDYEWLL